MKSSTLFFAISHRTRSSSLSPAGTSTLAGRATFANAAPDCRASTAAHSAQNLAADIGSSETSGCSTRACIRKAARMLAADAPSSNPSAAYGSP